MANDDTKLNVIDLGARREQEENKEHKEFAEEFVSVLGDLIKTVKEGRLNQVVIQWEEEIPGEENMVNSTVLHWNKDQDFDKALGYAERLKQRIFLISEGLVAQ